jgi:uncharacterized membrane protein
MTTVRKTLDVGVPVATAYNQYTQFESFPEFMEGVKQVRQLDDQRLHWTAEIGGQHREWEAEIVEQVPEQVIAWRSITGKTNDGRAMFKPLDAARCEITVEVEYDPEGLIETVGDKLGFVDKRVEGDLERFKSFVEARGVETGAYRGEIRAGQVQR